MECISEAKQACASQCWAHEESRVYCLLHSKISRCWCCGFLCPASRLYSVKSEVSRECPVLSLVCVCVCVCVYVGGGLGLESCITVVMSRLAARLIPQQHPALTRPLNKAFDPPAAEKVTACLWLPCLSVCIHGQEPSCHPFLLPFASSVPPVLSPWHACLHSNPSAFPNFAWIPSIHPSSFSDFFCNVRALKN